LIGQNGVQIRDVWDDIPIAYRGVCMTAFPNYWFVTGPNTGVGTTSIVFMIEQATRYILDCIEMAGKDKLVGVKSDALTAYNANIQAALSKTVWASGCKSWYLREDGRNATLYPYNARTWKKEMRQVREEDFLIDE
jgi:cation diffusion facilitator CzcD-associated flavoprotein CzcO